MDMAVNLDGDISVLTSIVNGYVSAWGNDTAFSYFLMHEMAHNTDIGQDIRDSQYALHLAEGGTAEDFNGSDVHFIEQEAQTNTLGQDIASELGLPFPTNPTYGTSPIS